MNLGKCKKCQNYRFSDISLDILRKWKENLGQEHVYPSRAKSGKIPLLSLEK